MMVGDGGGSDIVGSGSDGRTGGCGGDGDEDASLQGRGGDTSGVGAAAAGVADADADADTAAAATEGGAPLPGGGGWGASSEACRLRGTHGRLHRCKGVQGGARGCARHASVRALNGALRLHPLLRLPD